MKYLFLSIMVLFSALDVQATNSTVKIPYSTCAKNPYANGIGGTMYSRAVEDKKLTKRALELSKYTESEALTKLQKELPHLAIESAKVAIKGCCVYFRALSKERIYYFDAGNLALLQTKER